MAAVPMRRRTRIVCISDTHNCTVKLPKGDVLIHAGDLTNQGSHTEVRVPISVLSCCDLMKSLLSPLFVETTSSWLVSSFPRL